MDLPKLTTKQQNFILRYMINGNNASEAYRSAYDCSSMSSEAVNVEASRTLKNPKIALWIEQAENNVKQVFNDEIKYSAKDCFDELDELKKKSEKNITTYSVAKGCIELKGKLAGHFVDRHQVTGGGLADVLDKLR